jgi:serine/threonine-protein kinase
MSQSKVKKIGKYEVVDVLGRGGMGVVYKAVDPAIGRTVAIKMITGAFADDPDLLKRFYREAQSTGSLQHPNIVTVYDLGDQDGVPYLVIEFLEGEGLDKLIAGRRPFTMVDKLGLAIQVCSGLHFAHQRTVVHRDIKPPNVMVLKDGNIKIVDFGIARIGNDNLTRPGQMVGSIHYMSPEQVNAGAIDSRTDIFSTGVLLYELLTYALPFEGKDMGSTLLKILQEPPPQLSVYLKQYPAELDEILGRAMAKDRDERYQTAEDFGFDLIRVQEALKRDMVSEYIVRAQTLVQQEQWQKAKDEISQVLKIDRQNASAIELNRVIQSNIQKLQRSEQVKQLKAQAESAVTERRLDEAVAYLTEAISVDKTNPELLNLREVVQQARERQARFADAVRRAENAHDAGELDSAKAAIDEALSLVPEDAEAKTLQSAISRDLAERERDQKVQGLVDEARKEISSRRFTSAMEVLTKAEKIAPSAAISELLKLAASGREQEHRRKELEAAAAEIQDALDRDDVAAACIRADAALRKFPDDRALLKLKKLADNQLAASAKRKEIDAEMVASRKLLEAGNASEALARLRQAMERFPNDQGLRALLAIVTDTAQREELEGRKNEALHRAKDALRRKSYSEAIQLLENARAELGGPEFDDLLQFAHDQAQALERKSKLDAAAEHAQSLLNAGNYEAAVAFLESTLQETPDEELNIVLIEARRLIDDASRKINEAMATAERLLRSERFAECVRHLEAQPPTVQKNAAYQELLSRAREEYERCQVIGEAKEKVREAIAKEDFVTALATLTPAEARYPQSPELGLLRNEIAFKQSQAAKAAVEKALTDVRMLLLVRSYRAALNILSKVAEQIPACPEELRAKYEEYRAECTAGLEKQKRDTSVSAAAEAGETIAVGSSDATVVAGSAHGAAASAETIVAGSIASSPRVPAPVAPPVAPPPQAKAAPVAEPPKVAPVAPAKPVAPQQPPAAKAQPVAPPQPQPAAPSKAERVEAPAAKAAPPAKPAPPLSKKEAKRAAAAAKTAAPAPKTASPPQPQPAARSAPVAAEAAPVAAASSKKWLFVGGGAALLVAVIIIAVVTRKPSAPEAPAASTVAITIRSTPDGAAVRVKDQSCTTPNCSLQLAPGEYDAEATRDGYENATQHFTVAAGTPASVELNLRARAAAAPAPAEAAPAPPAAPPAATKATLAIAAALPGTQITVDGRHLGVTGGDGRSSVDVEAGTHSIELAKDGFETKRLQKRFAVGETVRLGRNDVTLAALPPPKPNTPTPAPAPAPVVNEAANEWSRVSGSNDANALEQFARKYAASPFAAEANRKVEQLRAEAARKAAAERASAAPPPQPVAPAPAPAPSPTASSNSADQRAILMLVGSYAAAYEARKAEQVARLWPSLPKDQFKKLQESFKNASSVRMSLQALEPTINGDHASISCARSMQWTFKGSAAPPVQDRISMKLSKQNGTWVIESVQ